MGRVPDCSVGPRSFQPSQWEILKLKLSPKEDCISQELACLSIPAMLSVQWGAARGKCGLGTNTGAITTPLVNYIPAAGDLSGTFSWLPPKAWLYTLAWYQHYLSPRGARCWGIKMHLGRPHHRAPLLTNCVISVRHFINLSIFLQNKLLRR